ncbi:MAG TPA: response regulator transcription factor [Kiritimatiellia bacterium]|nr:response regulator transcription factor [Kiritimatiellia bacterium]HMP33532.1 response regulator transcription factor [Kiritimatiellia bacterium]
MNTNTPRQPDPSEVDRILVVDDHPLVREALVGLLRRHSGIAVCGEADSIEQGIYLVAKHQPDLVLVDLMLHGRDGLDLVRHLHTHHPDIRTVVITMKDEESFAHKAQEAGAAGFIMKDRLTEDLRPAIDVVRFGGSWYPGRM